MPAPRGRRIALMVGSLALVALVVAAVAAKERLREEWHIWRLSSADDEIRGHALKILVEMKSTRVVPLLLRLGEEEENWPQFDPGMPGELADVILDPLSCALFRIGPTALPALRAASIQRPGLGQLIWLIESPTELRPDVICD